MKNSCGAEDSAGEFLPGIAPGHLRQGESEDRWDGSAQNSGCLDMFLYIYYNIWYLI